MRHQPLLPDEVRYPNQFVPKILVLYLVRRACSSFITVCLAFLRTHCLP